MPTTITELKDTVKDGAHAIPEEMVRDTMANIRNRCQARKATSGGYFQLFLRRF